MANRSYGQVIRELSQLPGQMNRVLSGVVKEAAELGKTDIVQTITSNVRPHMAYRGGKIKVKQVKGKKKRVKTRIRRIVTDLVDTGFYRSGWRVAHNVDGNPLVSEIYTNVGYAAVLEFGSRDGKRKGYYVTQAVVTRAPDFMARLANAALDDLLR